MSIENKTSAATNAQKVKKPLDITDIDEFLVELEKYQESDMFGLAKRAIHLQKDKYFAEILKRVPQKHFLFLLKDASGTGSLGCLKILLDRRDVGIKPNDELLSVPISRGHIEVVKLLIDDGRSDIFAQDDLALKTAKKYNNDEINSILFSSKQFVERKKGIKNRQNSSNIHISKKKVSISEMITIEPTKNETDITDEIFSHDVTTPDLTTEPITAWTSTRDVENLNGEMVEGSEVSEDDPPPLQRTQNIKIIKLKIEIQDNNDETITFKNVLRLQDLYEEIRTFVKFPFKLSAAGELLENNNELVTEHPLIMVRKLIIVHRIFKIGDLDVLYPKLDNDDTKLCEILVAHPSLTYDEAEKLKNTFSCDNFLVNVLKLLRFDLIPLCDETLKRSEILNIFETYAKSGNIKISGLLSLKEFDQQELEECVKISLKYKNNELLKLLMRHSLWKSRSFFNYTLFAVEYSSVELLKQLLTDSTVDPTMNNCKALVTAMSLREYAMQAVLFKYAKLEKDDPYFHASKYGMTGLVNRMLREEMVSGGKFTG